MARARARARAMVFLGNAREVAARRAGRKTLCSMVALRTRIRRADLRPLHYRAHPMRLTLRTALAAAVAALAFVTAAHADQLDDIKKKGVIVFGVLGTDEPNSFVDPKTRDIVGYEVDLAKAIAQKIGVKAVFKQLAVAARIPELQQGRVDVLAASLTHNKEREGQVDFSLTTFVTGQKVLVKKSSGITDVPQLAGKKVLTVKGGTQEPNIRKAVPGVDVVTFETTQQAFLALQQGKGVGSG